MKLQKTVIILIFILAVSLTAVFAANRSLEGSRTHADALIFEVQSITSQTSDGIEADIAEETWGRLIKIDYLCNYPYLKFFMTSNTGWSYTSDFITPDGEYCLEIPQEGMITVTARVYNLHQIEQESMAITSTVYMDNTTPLQPDIDLTALDTYHIDEFQLRYRIYTDNFSGVNFTDSWLAFMGEEQQDSIEPVSLDSIIPPARRDLDNYLTIGGNGVLTFYVVDNAGNGKEYNFTYSKHGVPETGIPVVTLDTEEYAKSVTLTINWGAGYDDNPFAEKKYAIVTASGSFPYDYTGPIEITTEGENEILIYYYENGEKKYVSRIIDNVDKTPPNLTIMQDTATISCNVMDENPVVFFIKATDRLSGIQRVFFKTGGDFQQLENGYYSAPIMDMYNFTVVAEDGAGNRTEYTYHNHYFDFATLKESNRKFLALVRAEYTLEGWSAVEQACNALSMLLIDDMAQSSEIADKARAIDIAIAGNITVINKIGAIPPGLDGGIAFQLDPSATDALKGESVSVKLDKAESGSLADEAGSMSGLKKRKVYPFSILLSGASADVHLTGSMTFDMPLPEGAIGGKLYADSEGTLIELVSEVRDGRIYAATTTVGEMYLVAERSGGDGIYIGGKLYSWSLLAITASIIVGVCGAGFLVTYLVLKKKRG
ncbi:MAG: hypothetical protein PHI19_03220 [Clostridia bacterium]|nr:hypothetical protein [Clostridia bacterium]